MVVEQPQQKSNYFREIETDVFHPVWLVNGKGWHREKTTSIKSNHSLSATGMVDLSNSINCAILET